MSQDLDTAMFNGVLAQLPRLRGLHVINCPRITHAAVLTALVHTPDLLELSFSLFVGLSLIPSPHPHPQHSRPKKTRSLNSTPPLPL